jgi:hypothetical protein
LKRQTVYTRPAALLLILAVSIQHFYKAIMIAGYYTAPSVYAVNCENKARPEMKCNGKCQLMKKLKREENKDQQFPERRADNKPETVLSSRSYFAAEPDMLLKTIAKARTPQHTYWLPTSEYGDIFHPPRA